MTIQRFAALLWTICEIASAVSECASKLNDMNSLIRRDVLEGYARVRECGPCTKETSSPTGIDIVQTGWEESQEQIRTKCAASNAETCDVSVSLMAPSKLEMRQMHYSTICRPSECTDPREWKNILKQQISAENGLSSTAFWFERYNGITQDCSTKDGCFFKFTICGETLEVPYKQSSIISLDTALEQLNAVPVAPAPAPVGKAAWKEEGEDEEEEEETTAKTEETMPREPKDDQVTDEIVNAESSDSNVGVTVFIIACVAIAVLATVAIYRRRQIVAESPIIMRVSSFDMPPIAAL